MTIRDIKDISKIIQSRIDLGIQLDQSILEEFEKKTKHTNFIFSNGIDFIYEIFNLDKDIKNENLSKVLKLFGKNKSLNSFFVKFADRGLRIWLLFLLFHLEELRYLLLHGVKHIVRTWMDSKKMNYRARDDVLTF